MSTRDAAAVGQCLSCVHTRRLVSARASDFFQCGLARTDPRFPAYPSLPVRACAGYAEAGAPET